MTQTTGVDQISPGTGSRVRARSAVQTNAAMLDLAGCWDFRWSSQIDAATDFLTEAALDPQDWHQIHLPAHWGMPGQPGLDRPIYTNLVYPFPVDLPHVPSQNPTGDHRLVFDLPADWPAQGQTHLRTEGIESWAKIWLNGHEIGTRSGSRLVQDFDVSAVLRPGTNVLAVRVAKWSAGSYLEDQDQWWLPGIFRTLALRHRPIGCIEDLWLDASWAVGEGRISPEVLATENSWPLIFEIPDLGLRRQWDTPQDVQPFDVGPVQGWSAEDPHLYSATLRSAGEIVSLRLGFRTVAIRDGVLEVNGEPIKLRGVNRHEFNTRTGRVIDLEAARADLMAMKAANIDAVRTAHQPPDPRWLDLADELGVWVMLECDLETHGFEFFGWKGNPVDDPAWREVLLDRVERTFERDKQHPSVIIWSLGNESGDGSNLAAMAKWLHQRDPHRPVHYEGDRRGAYTDIYSRMYPALEEIEAWQGDGAAIAVAHHPASSINADEAARVRQMPYLMVEYLHAMGTGPGGAHNYAQIIEADPRMAGGFVWEWQDHAITVRQPDGSDRQQYGGDFGEPIHDGDFVCDGLLLADGSSTPGLLDWSETVAPVRAHWSEVGGKCRILVESLRVFTSTEDLRLTWTFEVDGFPTACGQVPLKGGPQSVVSMPVPEELAAAVAAEHPHGAEAWLTLRVELARHTAWAHPGHRISERQYAPTLSRRQALPQHVEGPAGGKAAAPSAPLRTADGWVVGAAEFDSSGSLVRLGSMPITDHGLSLWRTPTDNDRGHGALDYEAADPRQTLGAGGGQRGPSSADRWHAAGIDRLEQRTASIRADGDKLLVITRTAPAGAMHGVQTRWEWTSGQAGLDCSLLVQPYGRWPGTWPRVGYHLELPSEYGSVRWFGLGPGESWPDLFSAVRVGRFDSTVANLETRYVRPQASGHRGDIRWVELTEGGTRGLRAERVDGSLGFSASPWSPHEAAVPHAYELPNSRATHLHLDFAQHGIGSRACGPDVRPEAQLWPREIKATFRLAEILR